MLADVPKADVIITNPTHLAIALRYDRKSMGAPRIVAKGARLNASQAQMLSAAVTDPREKAILERASGK